MCVFSTRTLYPTSHLHMYSLFLSLRSQVSGMLLRSVCTFKQHFLVRLLCGRRMMVQQVRMTCCQLILFRHLNCVCDIKRYFTPIIIVLFIFLHYPFYIFLITIFSDCFFLLFILSYFVIPRCGTRPCCGISRERNY